MNFIPRYLRSSLSILALAALALLVAGCNGSGDLNPKLNPETRLSNVPPDGITSENPRLTLSWIGDDADGFVVAYKYRWNFRLSAADTFQYKPWTTILNISLNNFALVMLGDEVVAPKVYRYFSTLPPEGLPADVTAALAAGDTITIEGVRLFASNPDAQKYPVHVNPNSGTFIFDSQDILNPHTFEIASIDNDGLLDPSPATLTFNTPQVAMPHGRMVASPVDTVLVLDHLTDTFEGVSFSFEGIDQNSRTLDYQWVVDKDIWLERTGRIPWSEFSPATTVRVTAADFPDKYGTNHTFYFRTRNEFGSIDTLGWYTVTSNEATGGTRIDTVYARANFNTVYPAFKRPGYTPKMLIINNAYDFDTLAVAPTRPSSAMLEQYYKDIYSELGWTEGVDYDIWRVNEVNKFPGRGMLGNYNKVHFVGDVVNFENFKWSKVTGTERALVPGRQAVLVDYCNIGGKMIFNGWNMTRSDQISVNDQFWRNILHISNQFSGFPPNSVQGQYIGSHPTSGSGYPDAMLDESKIDTLFHGGLPYQWSYQLSGFGEIVYNFDSKSDQFLLEAKPVGIRYLGITYDVFFLSFPLYYTDRAAAKEIIRRAHVEFDSPR